MHRRLKQIDRNLKQINRNLKQFDCANTINGGQRLVCIDQRRATIALDRSTEHNDWSVSINAAQRLVWIDQRDTTISRNLFLSTNNLHRNEAKQWKVSPEMFSVSAHVVTSHVPVIRYRLEPRAPYISPPIVIANLKKECFCRFHWSVSTARKSLEGWNLREG